MQWVVQTNLISKEDSKNLKDAIIRSGAAYTPIEIIPFTTEWANALKNHVNDFYYGSTTMMYTLWNSSKPKGLFFNPKKFLMSNYINQWGTHMLNSEATLTSIKLAHKTLQSFDDYVFIRPNDDSKCFSGHVVKRSDIVSWLNNLQKYDNVNLDAETEILIGNAYKVDEEWRAYIVDKKVITISRYRWGTKLKKDREVPKEVWEKAVQWLDMYQPYHSFVMDIGRCGGHLWIIECGCLNSAGLYAADLDLLVPAINQYIEK